MDEITGYIERITFQNEENGFTVARLQEPRKRELTVIVGTMPSVQAGETLRCRGQWRNDNQFGMQFQVQDYQVEVPATAEGIKKYLGSGMVKGIGPIFAERIVEYHGKNTLDIIDQTPEALLEVDGIGPKRLERIKICWEEQKAVREVMLFLQSNGVNPAYGQKIYKAYGDESLKTVQENPYQLARDIWGIGFKTADQIARKLGIEPHFDKRIDAGIEYTLNELANDGHTCYPLTGFLKTAAELLEVDAGLVEGRIDFMSAEARIQLAPLPIGKESAVHIWLQVFYQCEAGIVQEVRRLLHHSAPTLQDAAAVSDAETKLNLKLADQQRAAVMQALSMGTHIITGGPGTGKSTITRVILQIAKQYTKNILLAAPTGRAAKRLSEITGLPAQTIHSLLEYDFSIGGFRRNREHPLDTGMLIIDEASMIDTVLMYNLIKAVPEGAKLLFIGDVDQLPSVGAGTVLSDLIHSNKIPYTRLTEVFRQAAASRIIRSAHDINRGRLPDLRIDAEADFFFIQEEDPDGIANTIAGLVKTRLPAKYGFKPKTDIQVLTPMNRGRLGTRALNEDLQAILNPSTDPLTKLGRTFHLSDKVMQLRNDYNKEVFNGDIGYITGIDREEQELIVRFDEREVVYDFSEVDQLTLAYAATVHKYQGSECPCVVMPVHTSHYLMLFRNLIYTGVTRGKKLVVLVGPKKALAMAVRNNDPVKRHTGLQVALSSTI